jgi:SAM-dependent methyltransferase
MNHWTRTLFNRAYVNTEGLALPQSLTKRECQVVVRLLELKPDQQILDLACGHGRHSIELARMGYNHVLGLDFNQAAIEQAQQDATGTSTKFVQGDMMHLAYTAEFDVVLSLFNSMFYWDDATHLGILHGVHRALKPDGRLLLDSYNPFVAVHKKLLEQHPVIGKILAFRKYLGQIRRRLRHHLRSGGQPYAWHSTQTSFDPHLGRMIGSKTMQVGANQETHPINIRVYSYTEVEKLLLETGFTVEKVVSGTGEAFTASSPRFLVVAKK